MTAAKQQLAVEPVITAKEMADKDVDHLGVMAYAAWFQRALLSKVRPLQPVTQTKFVEDEVSANVYQPVNSTPPSDMLDVVLMHTHFSQLHPVSKACYYC